MEAAAGEIEAEQMELIAPQTAEEAAALEENRAALDTLRHQLEVVDAIQERMKKLDSLEMELTQGFTPEAYRVYRQVAADLEEHGGRPARAARISAAIFARHAQIVAETRQRNGEKDYTALDYAKTYRMGDAGEGKGFAQKAIKSVDLKAEAIKAVDMLTPEKMDTLLPKGNLMDRLNGQTGQKLLSMAVEKIGSYIGKKFSDPLGNEIHFAPGNTETLEGYALHLIAGMNKSVDDIRAKRVAGVFSAEETISNPWAIIVQQNGRKVYLRMYRDRSDFTNALIVGVEEGQEGRIVTSTIAMDKKGDKKAAMRELKKRISDAKEVLYMWEGLTEYPRPSSVHEASKVDTNLHPSGNLSIAESKAQNKQNIEKIFAEEKPSQIESLSEFKKLISDDIPNVPPKKVVATGSTGPIEAAKKAFSAAYPDGATVDTVIGDVNINEKSIQNSFSHGRIYQSKLDIVPHLVEGMKKAAYMGCLNDFSGRTIKNHYFAFPVMYENEKRYVVCRVKFPAGGKRSLYVHDVFKESEIKEKSRSIQTRPISPEATRYPRGSALLMNIVADFYAKGNSQVDINNIESLDQKVWHGSPYKRDDGKEHLTIEKGKFTGGNGKKAMQNALDWFVKNYPKGTVAATVIGDVQITKSGIKDSLSHGFSQKKLDVIPSLKEGLEQADFIKTIDDYDNKQIKNHFFVYKVLMDREENFVLCRAREQDGYKKLYIHEVMTAEQVKEKSASLHAGGAASSLTPRGIALYTSILQEYIEKVNGRAENYNQSTNGKITRMSDGQRVVTLLETADESTFLHEMGHLFLFDLEDLAQIDDVSKKELETVDEWASWEKGMAAEYKGTPWEDEFRKREQEIIDADAAGDHERADRLKRVLSKLR